MSKIKIENKEPDDEKNNLLICEVVFANIADIPVIDLVAYSNHLHSTMSICYGSLHSLSLLLIQLAYSRINQEIQRREEYLNEFLKKQKESEGSDLSDEMKDFLKTCL